MLTEARKMLHVNVSVIDYQKISAAARAQGQTMSEWVREACYAKMARLEKEKAQKK